MPPRNMGAVLAIACLIDGVDGEHYRPVVARKWTATHVWVTFTPDWAALSDESVWLRKSDVCRILRAADVRRRPRRGPVVHP